MERALLAWGARPGPRGTRLARINGVEPDQVYAVDLGATAVSGAGDVAFAVLPESGDRDSAHFDAREVSPSRGPVLRLTVDPTAPPVDAGTPAVDAPTVVDAGGVDVATPDISVVRDVAATPDAIVVRDVAVADAGRVDVGASTDDGLRELPEGPGCACRASTGTKTGSGWWALALAALALRRRRQRA
ncbi:MAG: MYXO-CTERM sorting domain-containing protein [Polyangiales bacterium]